MQCKTFFEAKRGINGINEVQEFPCKVIFVALKELSRLGDEKFIQMLS